MPDFYQTSHRHIDTHKHASKVHRVVDFEINESDARMRPLCAISQNTWTKLTAHTHAHQDKLYQLYLPTTVIGFKRIDWKHLHKTQQPIHRVKSIQIKLCEQKK